MFFIYRLTDGEKDYYGQTETPDRRLSEHKNTSCPCLSRLLDKSKIKLHIIHRLYNKKEADETEAFYQLNFPCVNNNITGKATRQFYYEKYKDKQKKQNKEKNNKRFNCECGGKYTHTNKSRHIKSKKHQDYINQI